MDWTFGNLAIQMAAGALGANAAATALPEFHFGLLRHILVGGAAGTASGLFLQGIVVIVVTGGGSLNQVSVVENAFLQGLTGICAGGVAMLAVGFARQLVSGVRR
jgi:hypothetical protein